MKDLAPSIYRQRVIIEGMCPKIITAKDIEDYLVKLSDVLKMKTLIKPVTHRSDKYGECGWIHWETSGAHFYAWEKPYIFFSVDIYTCKKFDARNAVNFTDKYFKTSSIEFKEV